MKVSPLLTVVCSSCTSDYVVATKPTVIPYTAAELDGLWRELAHAMPAMWALSGCCDANGMMTSAIQLTGRPCTHALLDVARIAMKSAAVALKGWTVEALKPSHNGRFPNGKG